MKRLSVIVLLLIGTVTPHAQHGGGSDLVSNPWWVGFGTGMNLWSDNKEGAEIDSPGFLFGVEAGRWMAPEWGLSLRASYFTTHSSLRSLSGLSFLGTVTLDWTNFGGEHPLGLHFYTPLSVGAAIASEDSNARSSFVMAAALGLRYDFGKVDLFGEAGLGVANFGLVPSFTVGMRFALPSHRESSYSPKGKRHKSNTSDEDYEPRGLVDDLLLANEQLHLPVAVVRFGREDDDLDNNALRQLNLFVSQIENTDWFTEFYIIGTADDAWASQSHNRKLCKSRCKAVYKVLVDDFEVDKYRLLMLPDGGFSEYAHQFGEQMVLIIQRTPETEEVVERWIPTY